jgi:hypothetical protein
MASHMPRGRKLEQKECKIHALVYTHAHILHNADKHGHSNANKRMQMRNHRNTDAIMDI